MGDPDGPELHRAEVLAALHRHGVEFVMVGGQTATAYGAQRVTDDLDVCVRYSPANLNRMGEVLVELHAGMRVEGLSEAFDVPHRDGAFLAGLEISTWRSPIGDIDVLRGLPSPHGEVRYDDLLQRAETFRIDDQAVKVASLDDVIASKQTRNRPSDIAALPSWWPSPAGCDTPSNGRGLHPCSARADPENRRPFRPKPPGGASGTDRL